MINKKTFILVAIAFSACCKDEIVSTHKLTDTQKSLIPFRGTKTLSFVDRDGEVFEANRNTNDPVVSTYRKGAESCQLGQTEELISRLTFNSTEIDVIELRLFADVFTSFGIRTERAGELTQRLHLACDDLENLIVEEAKQDIEIEGFNYTDVLVFESCSNTDAIRRLIYSSANGVEFIEYSDDNRWLKLN